MDVQLKNRPSPWDEAAQWFVRMQSPDCTGADRAAFENWLRADGAHWRAYAEAERVARRFDQLIETDESLGAMAEEALQQTGGAPRQRWVVPAALAASLIVGLAVVVRVTDHLDGAPAPVQTHANHSDRQRSIVLADHSVVHLDVQSEVLVELSAGARSITLTRGRALFEVARDATRPFVVTAGSTRTTALGTVFQVEREGERVVVLLTEGSVAVTPADDGHPWKEMLVPGEQLSMSNTQASPVKERLVDGLAETSWSRGRLVFRGTPLAEALDEVNRYSSRKVRLADPGLANLPVGGSFIAGDSELIVSALTAVLPIRPVDGGGGEILLFRRYETDLP